MRQRLRFPPLYCLRWIRYLILSRNTSYKLVVLPVSSIFSAVFTHSTHDICPKAQSRDFLCLLSDSLLIYPLFMQIKNCIWRFLTIKQRSVKCQLQIRFIYESPVQDQTNPIGICCPARIRRDAREFFCQCISFCYSPRGGTRYSHTDMEPHLSENVDVYFSGHPNLFCI